MRTIIGRNVRGNGLKGIFPRDIEEPGQFEGGQNIGCVIGTHQLRLENGIFKIQLYKRVGLHLHAFPAVADSFQSPLGQHLLQHRVIGIGKHNSVVRFEIVVQKPLGVLYALETAETQQVRLAHVGNQAQVGLRHRQQRTPPVPVKARRKVPTPEEIEARKKRLDAVEHRRRRQREAYERLEIADAAFKEEQARAAARKALWALAGIVVVAVAVILFASLGGKTNIELANAPVRKTFTAEELGRFSQFQGIEFGRVIAETPKEGDPIVFGTTTNTVGKVGLDGRIFEVELAEPIYKVFPQVRITLVDTEGGRRISGLTFERNGEVIKAERAKKVVSKIASHIEQEYGIDMGDTQTTINDAYFGQRYSDDFIDIRISSVVAPDSTSISFSIESRAVRAMEIVVAR